MKLRTPSKTALFDSISESKLTPLFWDADIMQEISLKTGGIHCSGIKPGEDPRYSSKLDAYTEDDGLKETQRDAQMISKYLNDDYSIMSLPDVTEYTEDGFTVRTLKVGQPYHKYGYDRNSALMVLSVRSDHDLYTRLDPNTIFIIYKYHWNQQLCFALWDTFAILPFSVGLWVADLCFLVRHNQATPEMQSWFRDNLVDGIFATEDMLIELESRAPEAVVEELFELRSKYNEDSMRMQANKVAYDFFYGDTQKIRLGIWKVSRGEINFSQRDSRIQIVFDNSHSVISLNVKGHQAGDVKAINNLDEIGLLKKMVQTPRIRTTLEDEVAALNAVYTELDLHINSVPVPISVKNRRYYIFGYTIKADEIHDLLQNLCCHNDPSDMMDLCKEVSLLSIKYRKFLTEGVVNTGIFRVTADRETPFNHKCWESREIRMLPGPTPTWEEVEENDDDYVEGGVTPDSSFGTPVMPPETLVAVPTRVHDYSNRRRMIVQENLKFKFERRGPRGLSLVQGKMRYPIYPYDLERPLCKSYGRGDYYGMAGWERAKDAEYIQIRFIRKILGDNVTVMEAKRILWGAFKNARVAIRRSRNLLAEVSAEIGAVKDRLRLQNKMTDVYIVTGTSGGRYAITDDSVYRVFREVLTNEPADRWVFVCIEGVGDMQQEVDKDKLVTKMLALANDQESVAQISTLKGYLPQPAPALTA